MVPFKRQLGAESGVQLNPLRDNSELPAGSNSDQVFAIAMRATRGRIDKAFAVNGGNARAKLGKGESVRVSPLNEAWVQVIEALNKGAYTAIVSRLHTSAAKLSWIVVKEEMSADEIPVATGGYTYSVSETEPVEPFVMAIKHLDCFNDGIKVSLHADEKRESGVNVANDSVTLRLLDADDVRVAEYTGSLTQGKLDDNNNSQYLPDIIESYTDSLEVQIGAINEIAPESEAYGYDASGRPKWVTSGVMDYFSEGPTVHEVEDCRRATRQLKNTPHKFGYLVSGGSESVALFDAMADLMHDINCQFRYDVPGHLDPEAAISWVENRNIGANKSAHLAHAFWAPLRSNDPSGINPKRHFGTAALNVAKCCARNAQVNAKGFAPKNYPVAGRDWPVDRSGIVQTYTPDDPELDKLARAKINPVIFEDYSGGGRYVWLDSITSAPVDNSLKKLISVVDMSTAVDTAVTRFAKDALQKPMKIAVKRTNDFLRDYFEGAEASDWIVPSSDPEMGGAAFRFQVTPNKSRPYELMDVQYWLRYDGTNRQTHATQTLSR